MTADRSALPASSGPRPSALGPRPSALGQAFDLLVIGGGATGLGVALDAATRGYRTLLVEARDFASGTSSRSTKLVHGGVRYLRQGQLGLVRDALHERARLLRNAPHVVRELRFLVPVYQRWQLPYYGAGLTIYDLLAGRLGLERARIVGPAEAARRVPAIRRAGLRGGVLYSDAQFDDARLALALAHTAVAHGATLLTYARVTSLVKERGRVAGAHVVDLEGGVEHTIRARVVVNATGVFSDSIRRLDDPAAAPVIAASRGVHLVLGREFLPGDTAVLVPRTDDGRVVFIIPWHGRTLVGTTDTPVDAPIEEPVADEAEVEFVLRHAGAYLARAPTRADVLSIFAGLRPLVRAATASTTARLGRDHSVMVSPAGLVTIAGGKWTTYRRMAEDAVDRAATVGGLLARPCRTADLPLAGARDASPRWPGFVATDAEVAAYEARFPGELHPRLPYSLAMLAYAVEREMPVRLDDLLARRVRALPLDARAAIEAAPRAAHLMADRQGRDDAWVKSQVAEFVDLARWWCAGDA